MSLKKIEFLENLFKKLQCRVEILGFLRDEKIISDDVVAHILNDPHNTHSTQIFSLLEKLQKEDKLQLVDYEWAILPKELIKLTLVTHSTKREFTYSV